MLNDGFWALHTSRDDANPQQVYREVDHGRPEEQVEIFARPGMNEWHIAGFWMAIDQLIPIPIQGIE